MKKWSVIILSIEVLAINSIILHENKIMRERNFGRFVLREVYNNSFTLVVYNDGETKKKLKNNSYFSTSLADCFL
jgi:Zn-finger domain-containing protein